jgi:hypothetical protein
MSRPATRRRRIVVGVHEIANNIHTIAEALRRAGYEVTTVADARSLGDRWSPTNYDRVIRADRVGGRIRFLMAMAMQLVRLARHDTFVFVWNTSFLPFQLDYPLLRLLRKDVVVLYCGDDIRYRPLQVQIDRELTDLVPYPLDDPDAMAGFLTGGVGFWQAFWSTKIAEKLGFTIMAARDTATFQGRDYILSRIPQPRLIEAPREPTDPPLIVHAPTHPTAKGTEHVKQAITLLREQGLKFRFDLIHDKSNAELLEHVLAADVVIDQPGTWISRSALEAMAAGCVVLGGNQPAYAGWPQGTAVIQFEPDGRKLADALLSLLEDRANRGRAMEASYDCWNSTFSDEAFTRFFSEVLDGSGPALSPVPEQRNIVLRNTRGRLRRAAIRLLW